MRETAGKLNRTWLTIIGLLALLIGVAGILIAGGSAATLAGSARLPVSPPAATESVVPAGTRDAFATDMAPIIMTIVAVLVGILALSWLLTQIPRKHQASTFRLHPSDGATGYTRVEPAVLAEAVENHLQRLPGVLDAHALLRGSSNKIDLTLSLKVDDRVDLQDVLARVHHDVAADLETALEAPLRKVAVLVNGVAHRRNDKTVTL